MGSKDDREQHLPRWRSTGNDEQHWRWATLAIGSTDDGGQYWRWAALTMDSTGGGQHCRWGNADDGQH
jgi:hypothetical protein